jgi:hypothetical protein
MIKLPADLSTGVTLITQKCKTVKELNFVKIVISFN